MVFTNAPPEFPGFTAASVCIKDCLLSPDKSLDLALIIPAVTVEVKLKGFPTAKTHSPIFAVSLSPKVVYGNTSSLSTFNKAISVFGSVPTIVAFNVLLSLSVTVNLSESAIT